MYFFSLINYLILLFHFISLVLIKYLFYLFFDIIFPIIYILLNINRIILLIYHI